MALFTANRISRVRLAREDGAGHDAAPNDLYVYLDTPAMERSGAGQFSFQEYQVSRGRLVPQSDTARSMRLDTSLHYWCVWSAQRLAAPPSSWEEEASFGYPLPALITNNRRLVLPNWRQVNIRAFNLSGQPQSDRRVASNLSVAERIFAKLHVRINVQWQTIPTRPAEQGEGAWPTVWIDLGRTGAGFYRAGSRTPCLPPLTSTPWQPSSANRRKTLVLLLVQEILGGNGISYTAFKLAPSPIGYASTGELTFDGRDHASVLCLGVGNNSAPTSRDLAHEIGHALLSDGGTGTSITGQEGVAPWKATIKRRILRNLGLLPTRQLNAANLEQMYTEMLPRAAHVSPTNLMDRHGSGNNFDHVQAALIRKASELRW